MTPIARGISVHDPRNPTPAKRTIVGITRADSDPIAQTAVVDWQGGGSSVVWVGRLVRAAE